VKRRLGFTEENVRTLLGCFLFSGDDVFKPIRVLSGGEKSRLALAKLLINPPNLLLMDEPTTHLDIPSIDALISALQQYEGTLIFISHDVHFIRSLAGHVVHVEAGKLVHYPGDYAYYLDKTSGRQERAASSNDSQSSPASDSRRGNLRERKRMEAEERQMRSRARKEQKLKVTTLENEIHELEQRQLELTEALENPETYADTAQALRVNRELSVVVDQLQELTAQWEKEAFRLSELESA
jgi:ATP-binding cassette subfamily F protein 3